MQLTTTQVSLIAALIALAAPAITYRATARLDRDRWVRQRRQFQARVEAFGTTQVIGLRDELLATWERYQTAADDKDKDALETHRAKVRVLYADLISLVREELKQDRDPWWRRTRRAA